MVFDPQIMNGKDQERFLTQGLRDHTEKMSSFVRNDLSNRCNLWIILSLPFGFQLSE